jgi:hypothetical protein
MKCASDEITSRGSIERRGVVLLMLLLLRGREVRLGKLSR